MSGVSAVGSVSGASAGMDPAEAASRSSSAAQADLVKYQKQLADWIDCPSRKTSYGKAKIAEINDKIHSAKAQIKKAEETQAVEAKPRNPAVDPAAVTPAMRFDGVGTYVQLQA